jgi:hypothetical protein
MAYLAIDEVGAIARFWTPAAPVVDETDLSDLEWSVVALARNDGLSTLREPGRVERAFTLLFSDRRNPRLTDPRLEALRRMSVLSWRRGYSVPPSDVRAFLAAGYSTAQYELLVNSIGAARADHHPAERRA